MPPRPKGSDLGQEIDRLQDLVAVADASGVRLGIETHIGTLTEAPETALQLIQAVAGLGLTLDVSHYYCNSREKAAEALLPFVYHVHLRDCGRGAENIQAPMGEGVVDFAHWFRLLQHNGYRGALTVEYIDLAGVDFDVVASAVACYRRCQALNAGITESRRSD